MGAAREDVGKAPRIELVHDLWNARYLKGISGGLVRAQRQLTYDRRGYIAGKRCREVDWGTLIERIGRR